MYVLGLNAYHGDSSACLVQDGKLLSAVEEERFLRVKHWAGFPVKSIEYCLAEAGIDLGQVDHIAINKDPNASLIKKVLFTLKNRPEFKLVVERLQSRKKTLSIADELRVHKLEGEFMGKIHHIEHHLSHLGSAFLVSPFEKSVILSMDGFGDFCSTAWGIGNETSMNIEGRVYFPHSLGIFYQALTQFIGFPNYGDEYKVMGLAPYGEPRFIDEMRKIVLLQSDGSYKLNLKYFCHHTADVSYEWKNCAPKVGQLFSRSLEDLLGPARKAEDPLTQREKDIARSVQVMYEEALFLLLNNLHQKYKNPNLAFAGGTAMNSVANGKITLKTPFENVYIQSAAGDAGGAIGAAMVCWNKVGENTRGFTMDHAFWGPEYSDDQLDLFLKDAQLQIDSEKISVQHISDEKTLCQKTAAAISEGKVIGWFQGKMEWGPRALGNRSILCDPRRSDMKDILNQKIKRRESFRPFAPSILRESVKEWFEQDDEVPFMMKVFQIREGKRKQIPAVCHADGSGRLQTVYKETNPLYYNLISEFNSISGVPMVLNTSFNENEPVVCTPKEALDCFLRTKMDVLVLKNYFISR
jgi:carbamoyltransferase